MTSHHDYSDAELVSLFNQGDQKAFETIYRRYASGLYHYARKSIAAKEDCEEIVQDVFESLWARHQNLTHVTALGPYLYQMVRFKVIRYLHHNRVRKKYADHYRLFEAVYDNSLEGERDPEAVRLLLEKGIAQLPERCQQAVRLRLQENLSNGDIARRMNIKKSTVENYMVSALAQLRASLKTSEK